MSKIFYTIVAGAALAVVFCIAALQTNSSTPSNTHFNPVTVDRNAEQAPTYTPQDAAKYGVYQNQLIQE